MKKVFSVLLATAMFATIASAFSGCELGKKYGGEVNWDVDLSTPIPLKGFFPQSGMASFGSDDTAAIIERETGYKVDYYEMGSGNIESDFQKALVDHQDYNFMKINDGCYTPYLDGTFLDLTELLEKTPEGRVLYQLIDLMDQGWDSVRYVDEEGNSHIYAIPDFGYVYMTDSALIWNVDHLRQIGFEEQYHHALPETLSEVTWALEELQKKFNPDGTTKYHALGIPGAASAEVTPIEGCFEVPNQFYVDENGKIQQENFSQNKLDYVLYMNSLYKKGILSEQWNTDGAPKTNELFAEELHSCVYFTYWSVTALVNAIKEKNVIAEKMGIENTTQAIHDQAIAWTTRIRGDGYSFTAPDGSTVTCPNQEKAMLAGDPGGVSYYTVIPNYMAENARHVINYLAKKMEAFAKFFGGNGLTLEEMKNGAQISDTTHWYEIETPAGAPAPEDYTEARDQEYTAHENFSDMICFVRPYSFSYVDGRSGTDQTVTVSEPGRWIKLTKRYVDFIANNSQYCTGTNAISAKIYCHLHEIGFNAWYYCDNFPDDDSYIHNPMYMCPPMKMWAPINILSRSHLLTGVESAIKDPDPAAVLKFYLDSARKKSVKKEGMTYYYWSDAISDEMTTWYNANRKG